VIVRTADLLVVPLALSRVSKDQQCRLERFPPAICRIDDYCGCANHEGAL